MFTSRFQDFDDPAASADCGAHLAALRAVLNRRGLDGFVVPRADAYQNEYVPRSEERLAWLTGFTGSAGLAIVLAHEAAIFVDGRYTVQVRGQVDAGLFAAHSIADDGPAEWIAAHVAAGARIGFDPWLHSADGVERLRRACENAEASLVPAEPNPIDEVWAGRPQPPAASVVLHAMDHAGESTADKLGRLQAAIRKGRADVLVLTDPHSVAWLFNIRGGDVAHTPLPLARALVPAEGRPILLVAGGKLSNAVRAALTENADIAEPAALDGEIDRLGAAHARVQLDPTGAPFHVLARLEAAGARVQRAADPVARLKAVKNAAEIAGARAAHRRDAVALCRFLAWLDRSAPSGVTEIGAAEALESFRRDTGVLKDLSFPTISAAGPNAALPHYRVTRASDRQITPGFYLVDSGAQYVDGTTDVTRTVAVGAVDPEMRDRFTRVLLGHIAIATAVFPRGTSGSQLDAFARRALWDAGLDFGHGTGHGVGSYLSVHEGPQRISKLGHVALEPGMIVSNEPGYYKEGAYGIRSENLVLVTEIEIPGAEQPMLGFETLTLAPFDQRALDPALLDPPAQAWLDAYHARVRDEIGPLLEGEDRAWLAAACAPLGSVRQGRAVPNQ
jgi:Xaa-Pro aminopeptidase